jgi:cell division septum initiation protein DivIVA
VKAEVIARHARRLTPDRLAAIVDGLRGESVASAERAEQLARDRRRESDEMGRRIAELERRIVELGEETVALRLEVERRDDRLRATYAEIERLNALIRTMESTRAWRTHRWLESVRGR